VRCRAALYELTLFFGGGDNKMDKLLLGWMLGVPLLVLIALQYFLS
jgi:hypothetical protein